MRIWLVLLAGCAPKVALDTTGGDAWTWSREVRGEASGCREVVVRGPASETRVPAGSFTATVPLVSGENTLEVVCGRAVATQAWDARLDREPAPPRQLDADWTDAVVYGVVPFFFGEGGFDDVGEQLDALDALGVTTLWLSPVADAADDDFGYAITDHHALRETFGSEEDLDELVDAAHDRGMAVILDLAVNHTSDRHPYFVSAETDPRSPYVSFFDRDENGEPTYYFDWENLPNLSYDEPAVRAMVLDAMSWWVERFEVDGFRLDAAWGVQRRAPDFFPTMRERLGPDVFLIAEASVRDGVWAAQGFDAAYDWTDELGVWAWRDAFDHPERTASTLRDAIETDTDVPVLRFLDNNDTGDRFAVRYGVDRTRVAAALLMTLPGIPVVFTGSETGAALTVYDEGPPLDWADPHGLRATWTEWIALRKAHEALRTGSLEWVASSDPVLAYWRRTEAQALLVALGFSDGPSELRPQAIDLRDVRDGTIFPAGRPIAIPANGVRLLSPKLQ